MCIEENKTRLVSTEKSLKIDLHCHSNYSDGHLSPEQLVLRAHNMQVDVLAITDHDSVSAYARAKMAQREQKRGLTLISGVELSTRWHGYDIHIIGLNIDTTNPLFSKRIASQQQTRLDRATKIADKLALCGFANIGERVFEKAGNHQITRAHFAKELVNTGAVKDIAQAFKQWLGKGKRAYVAPKWIDLGTAIDWIHDAGGQAALAHPSHYDMTTKWLRRLVAEFAQNGGDAIELNYPNLTSQKQKLLVEMALECDLMASHGSDFHYPSRWTELGRMSSLPSDIQPIWHDWGFDSLNDKASGV